MLSILLTYMFHLSDIVSICIPQDIFYIHFTCLGEENLGILLDWGNRINETEFFDRIRRIYCKPVIYLCLCFIYNNSITCNLQTYLKTYFRYTLNILMKLEIVALSP